MRPKKDTLIGSILTHEENTYRYRFTVPEEALDDNDHVNNVVYIEWVQDAAMRHSEASGGAEQTRAAGAVWVVVEHRVRYIRPAFLGDEIELRTWVDNVRRALSLRRTEIVRIDGGGGEQKVAEGWTEWAFVDTETGKPKRIPPAVIESFMPQQA